MIFQIEGEKFSGFHIILDNLEVDVFCNFKDGGTTLVVTVCSAYIKVILQPEI
ncbi:hypothetical protein ACFL05_00280 [Patescibacteria group bacterium]